MTRHIKAILADLKEHDYTMLHKYCECSMPEEAEPHFHKLECPVGHHAHKLHMLRLEYAEAYKKTLGYRARKAIAWLSQRHYTHLDMLLVNIGVVYVVLHDWLWAGIVFVVHLVTIAIKRWASE